jgi:YD repeat-containing protein
MIEWHFSPDTGSKFWLDWASKADFDPLSEIHCFADLTRFDHFQDYWLRYVKPRDWVPQAYQGKPFNIFETGGTTGMPKQRIGWEDYKHDYDEFSARYGDDVFPTGGDWLMLGPTGPRRLRLAIEHLANQRGGSCYFVDLDPRYVKKIIAAGKPELARDYQRHVIEQAVTILRYREIRCLFTTPKLLESLSEIVSIPDSGIVGAFCGGTTMTPQFTRFICEEVLENKTRFIPTYGNTLMGLACSKPGFENDGYSITYHAPQPRAVLRIVDPDDTTRTVDYDQWGRVELTTMTREFFMPRFLERDEALRRKPAEGLGFPWDGVAEVRPFGASKQAIVEGVY